MMLFQTLSIFVSRDHERNGSLYQANFSLLHQLDQVIPNLCHSWLNVVSTQDDAKLTCEPGENVKKYSLYIDASYQSTLSRAVSLHPIHHFY